MNVIEEIDFDFTYGGETHHAYARKYDDGTFDICVGTSEHGELDIVEDWLQEAAEVYFESNYNSKTGVIS